MKQVTFEEEQDEEGGAIRKPKKKEPKRNAKVEEALATERGGAIRKPKKKEPKRNAKVEEALATERGGKIKFHDKTHEYLYHKLSGRGGKLDSPVCRKLMHSVMSKYHPAIWNSYINGKVTDLPQHAAFHPARDIRPPVRRDASADVLDYGGSLLGLTHSESGYLMSHDSTVHPFVQIV